MFSLPGFVLEVLHKQSHLSLDRKLPEVRNEAYFVFQDKWYKEMLCTKCLAQFWALDGQSAFSEQMTE